MSSMRAVNKPPIDHFIQKVQLPNFFFILLIIFFIILIKLILQFTYKVMLKSALSNKRGLRWEI